MATCVDCGVAYCEHCDGEYAQVGGCVEEPLAFEVEGTVAWHQQIPYGSRREWHWRGAPPTDRCRDCAAEPGFVHHVGCVLATCPRCERQLLSCECELADLGEDDE